MPITLNTPIVVPAADEKQADKLWVLTLNINANDTTQSVKTYISVAPYITATNEVLRDQIQHISIEDTLTEAASNPTLAAAVQAIYDAVEELCKQQSLFGLTPDPVE